VAVESSQQRLEHDENAVLEIMADDHDASFQSIAIKAGFVNDGRPSKPKVQRVMRRLVEFGLATKHRNNKYRISKKGLEEIGRKS
jgi:repressor of nif and glnA expression